MKDSVPSVVARFFNVPESALTDSFILPPERLQGSISRRILHAALKRLAGAELPGVWKATTFGELTGGAATPAALAAAPARKTASGKSSHSVGIDLEQTAHLPWTGDPASDPFYVENFTPAETAYALRQPDPRQTLCGLWCAKEAAIKCGPEFAALRPAQIEILHDENGRPRLTVDGADLGCEISISHAEGTAVAVCIRHLGPTLPPPTAALPPAASAPAGAPWSATLALLLSIAAVIIALVSLLKR